MLPAANHQQKVRNAKPRLRSGGLAFLLEVAAENDKPQRKQSKHQRIFLWIKDYHIFVSIRIRTEVLSPTAK